MWLAWPLTCDWNLLLCHYHMSTRPWEEEQWPRSQSIRCRPVIGWQTIFSLPFCLRNPFEIHSITICSIHFLNLDNTKSRWWIGFKLRNWVRDMIMPLVCSVYIWLALPTRSAMGALHIFPFLYTTDHVSLIRLNMKCTLVICHFIDISLVKENEVLWFISIT